MTERPVEIIRWQDIEALHPDWWDDHPVHRLGPHDGRSGMRRGTKG